MKMSWMVLLGVLVTVIMFNPCIAMDESGMKTEKAVTAANAWLKLVDAGKYEMSWKTSAEYFRRVVTLSQWKQSLEAVRTPLGKTLKRTLKSAEYHTTLPGAPDGEYVVIQFETTFENKKSAVETVTPMREKDGSWKVSGYYIK